MENILEMQAQLRREKMTLDNGAEKIPILRRTCANSTSFPEGLRAVRKDNQQRWLSDVPGTVLQG